MATVTTTLISPIVDSTILANDADISVERHARDNQTDKVRTGRKPRGALTARQVDLTRLYARYTRHELITGDSLHAEPSPNVSATDIQKKLPPNTMVLPSGLTYFADGEHGYLSEETPLGLIYEIEFASDIPDSPFKKYHRGRIVRDGDCYDFAVRSDSEGNCTTLFTVNEKNQPYTTTEDSVILVSETPDFVLARDDQTCWIRYQGKIVMSSDFCLMGEFSGYFFEDLGIFVTQNKDIIQMNAERPSKPRLMTRRGELCVYWKGSVFPASGSRLFYDNQSRPYQLVTYADGSRVVVDICGKPRRYGDLHFNVDQSKDRPTAYFTLSPRHPTNAKALSYASKATQKPGITDTYYYFLMPLSRLLATSDDVLDNIFNNVENVTTRLFHEFSECLSVESRHIAASATTEDGKNFLSQDDWENPQIHFVVVPGGFVVYKKDIAETVPREWNKIQGITFTSPPPKTWPNGTRFESPKPIHEYRIFTTEKTRYALTSGQVGDTLKPPTLLWQENDDGIFRLVRGAQTLSLASASLEDHFITGIERFLDDNPDSVATTDDVVRIKRSPELASRGNPVYVKNGKTWDLTRVTRDFTPVMAAPFTPLTEKQFRPEHVIVFRKLPDDTIRPATLEELTAYLDEKLPSLPSPYLDEHHRIIGAAYARQAPNKSVTVLPSETIHLSAEYVLKTRRLVTQFAPMARLQITRGPQLPDCIVSYPMPLEPITKAAKKEGFYIPTQDDALKLYSILYKILPKKVADLVRSIRIMPAATEKCLATYNYEKHEITVFGAKVSDQKSWFAYVSAALISHEVLGHGLINPKSLESKSPTDLELIDLALMTLVVDGTLPNYGTTDWREYIATLAEYYSWLPSHSSKMPYGYRLMHKIVMDFLTSST